MSELHNMLSKRLGDDNTVTAQDQMSANAQLFLDMKVGLIRTIPSLARQYTLLHGCELNILC